MLRNLLKISNLFELENAINKDDINEVIHRAINLSVLEIDEFDLEEYDLHSKGLKGQMDKVKSSDSQLLNGFSVINDDPEPLSKMYESKASLELYEDSEIPSFIRKREGEDDVEIEDPNDSDPPELRALILVLKKSKSFKTLSITKKNKLIKEFKEKLITEKNIQNKFNAGLPRPGSRTKLRNTIDRYVLNGKDKDVLTIVDLKKKIITDGYLIMDPTPDNEGNLIYKVTDKLKAIFGKDLKNNSINDRSLYEIIRRSLQEININKINVKY